MSEDGEIRILLAAEPQSVSRARELLVRVLDDAGVEGEAQRDGLLVVSELVNNAIEHGSRTGDEISVAYTVKNDHLCICVSDDLRSDSVPVALTPDEQRPAGRGLNLVDQLAEWSERVVDGRREVRAQLRLGATR